MSKITVLLGQKDHKNFILGQKDKMHFDFGQIKTIVPKGFANVSNVTAKAEDVLSGKIFVDSKGNETIGTLNPQGGTINEEEFNLAYVMQMDLLANAINGEKVYDYSIEEINNMEQVLINISNGGING